METWRIIVLSVLPQCVLEPCYGLYVIEINLEKNYNQLYLLYKFKNNTHIISYLRNIN